MNKSNKFSPEVKERAVRLVQEHRSEYSSLWATIESIAPKIGCAPPTLHDWVKKHEIDTGLRDGVTSEERERIKALEREVKELRRANEILKLVSAFFAQVELVNSNPEVVHRPASRRPRDRADLQGIAGRPSGYRRHAVELRNPALRCARAIRDDELIPQIQRVWQINLQVYGADKVWRQLKREGIQVARCTVERLMKRLGLQGVRRGKVVRTTVTDKVLTCRLDRVNRQFKADRPNQLWVSDFTYVSTWQGWLYVAFVIDVFARYIVGWRVSSSMHTDFVLDALEQALYARQPELGALVIPPFLPGACSREF